MLPLFLVDGYNFLHAVLLEGRDRAEWWSPQKRALVIDWLTRHRGSEPAELWVVFDQRGSASERALDPVQGTLRVCYAPDADASILASCAELAATREVIVVSADRSLCDRARRHGAGRLSPWKFAATRG